MDKMVTRKELRLAAKQYMAAWLASIPESEENANPLSERFEKNVQPVLTTGSRRARQRAMLYRAAAAVLAVVLIGGIGLGIGLGNRASADGQQLPENSIFREIILEGSNTYIKGVEYGMTFEEMLEAQNLSPDDLEILEYDTYDGRHHEIQATTKAEYLYAECPDFGLKKFFEFRDGQLSDFMFIRQFDFLEDEEEEFLLRVGQAKDFIDTFIVYTSATQLDFDVADRMQYFIEGELPVSLAEGGSYGAVFVPGILAAVGMNTQDVRNAAHERFQGIDYILYVSVDFAFLRVQNQRVREDYPEESIEWMEENEVDIPQSMSE